MVVAMTDTDIEQFIREQKNKLYRDRNNLEENAIPPVPPPELLARKYRSQQDLNIERLEQQLNELRAMSVAAGEKMVSARQSAKEAGLAQPKTKVVTTATEKMAVVGFLDKFGEYDKKKKKLREELENDYQKHLAGISTRKILHRNEKNSKRLVENTSAQPGFKGNLSPDMFRGADRPLQHSRLKSNENYSQETNREGTSSRHYQPLLHEEIESRLRRTQSPLLQISNNLLNDPLWDKLREGPRQLDSDILPLPSSHPLPSLPPTTLPDDYFRLTNVPELSRHQVPENPPVPSRSCYSPKKSEETYATLPLGVERKSAKQRQKLNYREELQRQINEKKVARMEEKEISKKVYEPMLPLGQAKDTKQTAKNNFPPDYRSSPLNPQQPQLPVRYTGLDSQLMNRNLTSVPQPNQLQPLPPSLLYEPTGLLQDGGVNSIDDAYRYYGMNDHFNGTSMPPGIESAFFTNKPEPQETLTLPKQLLFNEKKTQENFTSLPGALEFSRLQDNKADNRKKEQMYMKALEMQIQEKKAQKLREKLEQDRYDKNLEEQSRNYNPFGRGGGGAPLKDSSGNVLANLRQIKKDLMNDDLTAKLNQLSQINQIGASPSPNSAVPPTVTLTVPSVSPNPGLENIHARGGHGIFGQPKTDLQKSSMDQYRDELQKQIMEKKSRKQAEIELQKQEEQKINKRLEEDRKKMQEEFELEMKKKKAKAEEERKREEEMKQQLEQKKAAAEKQLKEAEEKRERERLERERQLKEQQQQYEHQQEAPRPKSPPVPALHRKIKTNSSKQTSPRESVSSIRPASTRPPSSTRPDPPVTVPKAPPSPPISTVPKTAPRAQSADVLNQLKVLKKGLHQKLLETDLRDAVGYDGTSGMLGKDSAPINRKAVLLRRGSHHVSDSPALPNAEVLKDFNQLKYRGDSATRSIFRSRFPDPPTDISSLELQQREMIKQQEETLRRIRDNGSYKYNYENGHPPLLRQKTVSPLPMLDSKSAFYDPDHMAPLNQLFPDDHHHHANKNQSARSRRHKRLHSPQLTPLDSDPLRCNSATSYASLNPDMLAAKNEERLKKLQNMTDAISLTEPEEILDKFMLKQNPSTPSSIY
ncbi:centrosome and spindle pole associated protein 1-like [Argonauta hians]